MFSLTSLTAIIKNRNNTDNLVHQRSPYVTIWGDLKRMSTKRTMHHILSLLIVESIYLSSEGRCMVLTCCFRFLKHKLKVILNKEKKVKKKKGMKKLKHIVALIQSILARELHSQLLTHKFTNIAYVSISQQIVGKRICLWFWFF